MTEARAVWKTARARSTNGSQCTVTVSNETDTGRRAAVYRLYDAEGPLLYIGSAYDPKRRSKKHRDKDWWPRVARRDDEWYPTREAAYVAETDAIALLRPPGNKISGPGPVAMPALRSRARTAGPVFVLAELDAFFEQVDAEPPGVRFRMLTEMMETLEAAVFARRRSLFEEMRAEGMTYREIGAAVGISFGRVRQILSVETKETS